MIDLIQEKLAAYNAANHFTEPQIIIQKNKPAFAVFFSWMLIRMIRKPRGDDHEISIRHGRL